MIEWSQEPKLDILMKANGNLKRPYRTIHIIMAVHFGTVSE